MIMATALPTTTNKPAYLVNGHSGSGGSSHGKSTSPCSSLINHVALDDERRLKEMYDFGEKLGRGSFGVVWLVTHIGTGQRYACKIINKEKVQGQKILKLIDREVTILKSVSHDNIIELKEVFETTQRMYLVMELCEGGELSSLLDEHGLFSEDETKAVVEQLARAISYLHRHGKVHRDLKLENILLSRTEENIEDICIKVTDFGLSIEKDGVGTDSMMDDYCGTPLYMSPEITENKLYSEKCDIWAMGIITFKLLTGVNNELLSEMTNRQGFRKRLAEPCWSHISNCVKDCLSGMLRWDPAHRFTADEVLDHPWLKGDELDVKKRLNVLEMMKEFRTIMDDDDDDNKERGKDSTEHNIADGKSPSPGRTTRNSSPVKARPPSCRGRGSSPSKFGLSSAASSAVSGRRPSILGARASYGPPSTQPPGGDQRKPPVTRTRSNRCPAATSTAKSPTSTSKSVVPAGHRTLSRVTSVTAQTAAVATSKKPLSRQRSGPPS